MGGVFDDLAAGSYAVIAADPPWRFKSNSAARPGRNPQRHYSCMSSEAIAALPVATLAAENCALFLWTTGPMLAIGAHLPVMRAWGFKPSGIAFVWIKTNRDGETLFTGPGFTTRKNAEICLLGRKGRSVRRSRSVHEVIVAGRREHSRKPDEFYARVEAYAGDVRRAELFARQRRPGWDAWGDELELFGEEAACSRSRHPRPERQAERMGPPGPPGASRRLRMAESKQ